MCANFSTGLNSALVVYQYPLTDLGDPFASLNGETCFVKMGYSDAYLKVEIDYYCRELLNINTHRGLFQYIRLPFGITITPTIFQQMIDKMLTSISVTAAYLGDIIVIGSTDNDISDRVHQVLK